MTVHDRDGKVKITAMRTFSVGDNGKHKSLHDDGLNYIDNVARPDFIDLNFAIKGLSQHFRGFARFSKRLYSVSRVFLGTYALNSRLNRNFIN
jgi:hypothetical protein